jgi:protein-disulfide isomerase
VQSGRIPAYRPRVTDPNESVIAMIRRTFLTLAATVGAVALYGAAGPERLFPAMGDLLVSPAHAATSEEMMQPGPLGEMALGDANAPNVVIEYASMTCSHCAAFHAETWPAFKEKYIDTGKVYFIFREYPLDALATAAFMLARCGPKERYFPLVDLMFDRQAEWAFTENPKQALLAFVRQAGFTEESFNACLTNQELQDGVLAVKNRGSTEFGVSSTPTFFINGELHRGGFSIEEFDEILAD